MVAVGAIVADGNRTWCANTLRSKWQCLEVVIDKCVTPVFQRNGISTTLVVLNIKQGYWCPGIAIVMGCILLSSVLIASVDSTGIHFH